LRALHLVSPQNPASETLGVPASQSKIFDSGKRGDEAEILVDNANSLTVLLCEMPKIDTRSSKLDIAAMVGLHIAAEQLNHRRLARTVLSNEGVDFPRSNLQSSIVERDLSWVCLRKRADINDRSTTQIGGTPVDEKVGH
jgi:hypothetical protein